VSPCDRFMRDVSNRISSAVWFSIWIVILLLEDWMDSIVPVLVCFVVLARRIKRRVAARDIMKIVFWKFMVLGGYIFLNIC